MLKEWRVFQSGAETGDLEQEFASNVTTNV